jgi:hypothetical protein
MRLRFSTNRLLVGSSIVVLLAGCAPDVTPSPSTTAVATAAPTPAAATLPPTSAPSPGAGPAGSMATARGGHTATLLPDGRVLVAGGASSVADGAVGGVVALAEIYVPATGTFAATGSMATARLGHTATPLADGRVLVAAGLDVPRPGAVSDLATAEICDPASGTFVPTGPMAAARDGTTATLLPDGRVLVAGGFDREAGYLATAEIYDPATGTFGPTGPLATARWRHTAALLPDGRVLVAGGFAREAGGPAYLATAEIYDPATATFVATGSMATARAGATATVLTDGRVLVAGGTDGSENGTATAELYDPTTGTFVATGQMATPREGHTATLLADGRVLLVGGLGPLATAEIYDPATGTFSGTGPMTTARNGNTATLLPDGRVLVVGGFDGAAYLATAELFDPTAGSFVPAGP